MSGTSVVDLRGDTKSNTTYQFAPFLFLIMSFGFLLPRVIYKLIESDTFHRILQNVTLEIQEPEVTYKEITLLSAYLKRKRGDHIVIAIFYILKDILYLVNIVIQVAFLNMYFNGLFIGYKWDQRDEIFPKI